MKFADEFRDPAAARGLREGRCEVENQYSRVVRDEGNPAALVLMAEVFELRPRFEWRGLGFVSRSVVSPEEPARPTTTSAAWTGRRPRSPAGRRRPPMADEPPTGKGGERLFARYAYAPNHLGYCGPADTAALAELASTGRTEADVRSIASRFSGAWPYLSVLAELAGIADPLDERVVRAYWTGSSLLDEVDRPRFWRDLLDRIAAAGAGRYWTHLKPGLISEAMPTHGFHVFGVYPWTRLSSAGIKDRPCTCSTAAASGGPG